MTPQINKLSLMFVLLIASLGVLAGCSGQDVPVNVSQEIEMRDERISQLENETQTQKAALEQSRREAEAAAERARQAEAAAKYAESNSSKTGSTKADLLPPNAKAGECYARVVVPPVYETTSERMLVKEASAKIDIVPAEYQWVEEKVLVKEAGEKLIVVPATYKTVEEKILVKAASSHMVEVPAVYETVEEKVLVSPAREYWKKGRGPIEKVDNATGEIMCLVKEDAVYKTISKRILKKEATTREETIPAEYKTVTRTVVDKPAHTRTEVIPAVYETVKVRQLKSGPREVRTPVEAEYRTVSKTVMSEPSYMEWRRIMCETNMTHSNILELQRALKNKNFDPGPLDGVYGKQTMAAVRSFQKANGMASGQLTVETMKALGLVF